MNDQQRYAYDNAYSQPAEVLDVGHFIAYPSPPFIVAVALSVNR